MLNARFLSSQLRISHGLAFKFLLIPQSFLIISLMQCHGANNSSMNPANEVHETQYFCSVAQAVSFVQCLWLTGHIHLGDQLLQEW